MLTRPNSERAPPSTTIERSAETIPYSNRTGALTARPTVSTRSGTNFSPRNTLSDFVKSFSYSVITGFVLYFLASPLHRSRECSLCS